MRNKLKFKNAQTQTRVENMVKESSVHNEAIGAELKAGGYYCQTHKDPVTIEAKRTAKKKRKAKWKERKSLPKLVIATAAGRGYG